MYTIYIQIIIIIFLIRKIYLLYYHIISNLLMKTKNVKFNQQDDINIVKKYDYIDIVGDFREPNINPNYLLIAQERTRRLQNFALQMPLISWNRKSLIFIKWRDLLHDKSM